MKLKVLFTAVCIWSFAGMIRAQGVEEEEEFLFREGFYMSEREEEARVSQAVRVGGVVFVSATTAPGLNVEEQMATVYIRIQSTLAHYGLTMANVAQERVYALDLQAVEAASDLRSRYYRQDPAPAASFVQVSKLQGEGALVAIEVIAVADSD